MHGLEGRGMEDTRALASLCMLGKSQFPLSPAQGREGLLGRQLGRGSTGQQAALCRVCRSKVRC